MALVIPPLAITILAIAILAFVVFGMTDWFEIIALAVVVGFIYTTFK